MSHSFVAQPQSKYHKYFQLNVGVNGWPRIALRPWAFLRRGILTRFTCKHPFRIFTEQHSHNRKRYTPHSLKPRKSVLRLASTDDWSKDNAILNTRRRGVGFDSSHRNKNENFAPVTLLTTTNEFGRMLPCMSGPRLINPLVLQSFPVANITTD